MGAAGGLAAIAVVSGLATMGASLTALAGAAAGGAAGTGLMALSGALATFAVGTAAAGGLAVLLGGVYELGHYLAKTAPVEKELQKKDDDAAKAIEQFHKDHPGKWPGFMDLMKMMPQFSPTAYHPDRDTTVKVTPVNATFTLDGRAVAKGVIQFTGDMLGGQDPRSPNVFDPSTSPRFPGHTYTTVT